MTCKPKEPEAPADQNLNTAQAAKYLGIKKGTLDTWRSREAYGIPYFRIGSRVRYRRADLDAWLQSRKIGGVA